MKVRSLNADLRKFGSAVMVARVKSGMSAAEFAKRIDVSLSMVSRIEGGSREPRMELIRRICRILPEFYPIVTDYLRDGKWPENIQ